MIEDDDEDDQLISNQPETLASGESIPLDFHFLNYEDPVDDDDRADCEKVEIAESVPINYKFVHIKNDDGDELVKIEDTSKVPLNFDFLQTGAPDDNPLKIETIQTAGEIPLGFRF